MTTFRYFAYGSNMLTKRLTGRCPSALVLGAVELSDFELRWHKVSKDGSGKCDITKAEGNKIYGVLYEIEDGELSVLDKAEGVGAGYKREQISLDLNGETAAVTTYFATKTDASLKPYCWYKACVVEGAKENGLPADYVKALETVKCEEDTNRERDRKNRP